MDSPLAPLSAPTVPRWRWLVFMLLCLVLTLTLQSWHGAYQSDLGEDPDEPAHAVTALMMHDYYANAFGTNPLNFAKDFYTRMPKVALGHYPPAFYLLGGLWLLPFPTIGALLALQATIVAALATAVARWGAKFLPLWLACLTGVALCFAAPVQKNLLVVMADVNLALVCMLAAMSFACYLEKPTVRNALFFGALAALAILTKGSGWALAILPPAAIALTGQWKLLFRPSLWAAPVPVIVFALPWQLISLKVTERGMSNLTPWQHFQEALPFYTTAFPDNFGWAFGVVLLGGFAMVLRQRLRGVALPAPQAAMWALGAGATVVLMTVPTGVTPRYLMPLIAPMLLVCADTIMQLKASSTTRAAVLLRGALLAVLAGSLWLGCLHKDHRKAVSGYASTVAALVQEASKGGSWLVCSDPRGEGAMIAAAAFDAAVRNNRDFRMLRASKELASMDWLARGYTPKFQDDAALLGFLSKAAVKRVFIDDSVPPILRQAHYEQLHHALTATGSGWRRERSVPVVRSDGTASFMQLFVREGS
ncbi:MAG: ArnT family glycosyltransferase [Roseimicrobium sp.]